MTIPIVLRWLGVARKAANCAPSLAVSVSDCGEEAAPSIGSIGGCAPSSKHMAFLLLASSCAVAGREHGYGPIVQPQGTRVLEHLNYACGCTHITARHQTTAEVPPSALIATPVM